MLVVFLPLLLLHPSILCAVFVVEPAACAVVAAVVAATDAVTKRPKKHVHCT